MQEIEVELYPSPIESNKKILLFKLLNFQHKDIFSVLCEDLINSVANETNERNLIKQILNRLEKWKSLFIKIGLQGLTPEQQLGLYGELYFLRKLLNSSNNNLLHIKSWVGTEKQVRDFQSDNWALEVKTTHSNNHQKLYISSERQLDTSNVKNLFLFHLSLDKVHNSGENLNEIIQSIYDILQTEIILLNMFKNKIYEVGYFDIHKRLYEDIGYSIRQDIFYEVINDFPRIEEKDLRAGVGDIKYSIITSQCTSYIIEETEVLAIINS